MHFTTGVNPLQVWEPGDDDDPGLEPLTLAMTDDGKIWIVGQRTDDTGDGRIWATSVHAIRKRDTAPGFSIDSHQ